VTIAHLQRILALAFFVAITLSAAEPTPQQIEFFEKKIRPVLTQKCAMCHSAKLEAPMGGLQVDSREALLRGGDSGPAIVAGRPAASLLIKAVAYRDLDLQMPPTGRLSDNEIADLGAWIEMGAPDPRSASIGERPKGLDLAEGRKFWSFQPVRDPSPPPVGDSEWPSSAVDAFILAKLKEAGLQPAPPAGKRTWIRRVSFDLIGLPPTSAEIDAFLVDESAEARDKVVDRLLASPHYGERWARHWLDLVRFAETNGHEFDNDKLDAWRYRDYVIRALNEDVPYDRLVREHIAGDLMAGKRLSADGSHWESPLGTTHFWFGEVLNSATDSVKSRADEVDNQIDVMGKAFVGMTIACARCHDHKFDPIPTADYYALAGVMHSTGIREAVIDSPARAEEIASLSRRIAHVNRGIDALIAPVSESQRAACGSPESWRRVGDIEFELFKNPSYDGWDSTGNAFGAGPRFAIPPNQAIRDYQGQGIANSFGVGSDKLVGSITSAKFRMPRLWVHVRLVGTKEGKPGMRERAPLRLTVVADGHKSAHALPSGSGEFEWKTMRMTKEIGRTCYIEIVDRSRTGHIAVDRIVISDEKEPPSDAGSCGRDGKAEDTVESLTRSQRRMLAWLQAERARLDAQIPESTFAMIGRDEEPRDVALHIRGNHNKLGEPVPRRYLQVIAGEEQPAVGHGSGRLRIAEWMASADNPLTARVMVNRLWRHHFGRGIVATTDNFGETGERPTHPELLDYLASRFVESGWSIKAMHRLILLSSAYRMSAAPDARAIEIDPQNKLVHHVPVRRLEAETIRDSILAVAGKLDSTMYGPSVPPHISEYQNGRGKPDSGSLDGDGRRSVYVQVRRNFLTPLFLAFDYPLPISAIGTRGASTVPSQALMLMNNEFVALEAREWGTQTVRAYSDPGRRIEAMYLAAFGRPPKDAEVEQISAFLAGQQRRYTQTDANQKTESKVWGDLAHVLLNSAEFVYIR
jgi:cytochrome c553